MTIRSEGTDTNPHTGEKLDPYRVCFGYTHTIQSLADHPADNPLENWTGAHYVLNGIQSLSTAAGAYQIIRATWRTAKAQCRLPDFGADSQDAAALWLVKDKHAIDMVNRGDITGAVQACNDVWASFAGSDVGQPMRSWDFLHDAFQVAGGRLA